MSPWLKFLNKLESENQSRVTLVGPLLDRTHVAKEPTVYVDGGIKRRAPSDLAPVVSVGDGDSGPQLQLDERLNPDKDYSDLAYALRALPKCVTEITLLGFLGGHRDHEMANLGEAVAFLNQRGPGARVELFEPGPERVFVLGPGQAQMKIHGVFSLFTISAQNVQITGSCKYKLPSPTAIDPFSSRGLSNEGFGQIDLRSDGIYLLFLRA